MDCTIDVQEKKDNSNRFLIKSSNRRKLRKIVIFFYIAILACTIDQWVSIFSTFLTDDTKGVICLVTSGIFAAIPCINITAELLSSAWNIYMNDLEKSNILICVKAVFDFIIILGILKEWRHVYDYKMKFETSSRIVLASCALFLSQKITDDLDSSSITAILTSAMMILTINAIRKNKFENIKSALRPFIGFLSHGLPRSTKVASSLENIVPIFLVGHLVVLASGLLLRIEKRFAKYIRLPSDKLLFVYGLMLFILALYISKEGEEMAMNIIKDAAPSGAQNVQRAVGGFFSRHGKRLGLW